MYLKSQYMNLFSSKFAHHCPDCEINVKLCYIYVMFEHKTRRNLLSD